MGKIDAPDVEVHEIPTQTEAKISEITSMAEVEDMETYQAAKFLDADQDDQDSMEKIKGMVEWCKTNGLNTFSDIAMKLHDIEVKIGSPGMGEKRIPRIYRYIKLLNQQGKLNQELKAYER